MYKTRLLLIIGGVSITCANTFVSALAEGTKNGASASTNEPTQEDLRKSGARGFMFAPIQKPAEQPAEAVKKETVKKHVAIKKLKPKATKTAAANEGYRGMTWTLPSPRHTVAPVKRTISIQPLPSSSSSSNKPQFSTVASTTTIAADAHIVKAWLNRNGSNPHFKDGELVDVNVTASRDCNVMVWDFDGKTLTQVFPNHIQQDNFVRGGQTVVIGGPESSFAFRATIPKGLNLSAERLFVYAYPKDDSAPVSVAMLRDVPNSPFRSTDMTQEQYRDLVNKSKIYVPNDRVLTVVPKNSAASNSGKEEVAPNKVELLYSIEK